MAARPRLPRTPSNPCSSESSSNRFSRSSAGGAAGSTGSPSVSVVTFATLPDRLLPDASAIFHLLRNFGSSIFISFSVLTVVHTGTVAYAEISAPINPFNKVFDFAGITGLWSIDSTSGLGALASEVSRQATLIGYNNAFVMYALAAVATLPLMLFIKIRQR